VFLLLAVLPFVAFVALAPVDRVIPLEVRFLQACDAGNSSSIVEQGPNGLSVWQKDTYVCRESFNSACASLDLELKERAFDWISDQMDPKGSLIRRSYLWNVSRYATGRVKIVVEPVGDSTRLAVLKESAPLSWFDRLCRRFKLCF
jgi:hypothetical protein